MAQLKFTGYYTSTYRTTWTNLTDHMRREVDKIPGMSYEALGAQSMQGAASSMSEEWHQMSLTYQGPAEKADAFREACVAGIAKYKQGYPDPVLLDGPFGEVYVDGNPVSAPSMLVVEV